MPFSSHLILLFLDSRVASIQRQLNLYGFRCAHRGEEKGVFFHPKFVRGAYDDALNIRRLKTSHSAASSADDDASPRGNSAKRVKRNDTIDDGETKISTCLTLIGKRFYDEMLNEEPGNCAHSAVVTDSSESVQSGDDKIVGVSSSAPNIPHRPEKKTKGSTRDQMNTKAASSHSTKVVTSGTVREMKSVTVPNREFNTIDYVDDNWIHVKSVVQR